MHFPPKPTYQISRSAWLLIMHKVMHDSDQKSTFSQSVNSYTAKGIQSIPTSYNSWVYPSSVLGCDEPGSRATCYPHHRLNRHSQHHCKIYKYDIIIIIDNPSDNHRLRFGRSST